MKTSEFYLVVPEDQAFSQQRAENLNKVGETLRRMGNVGEFANKNPKMTEENHKYWLCVAMSCKIIKVVEVKQEIDFNIHNALNE